VVSVRQRRAFFSRSLWQMRMATQHSNWKGNKIMAEITIQIDEQELWDAVFGSAFESFGTHWHEIEYLNNTKWDKIGKVRLVAIDEMTLEKTEKVVGIEELLKALPIANKQVSMDLYDLDDYDAICGDAVLQVAVLGEVVYG
jgi:hypothetical protein